MGLPAFALSESAAANDNDHGPTSRNPCMWTAYARACAKGGLHSVAQFAVEAKFRGDDFEEFARWLKAQVEWDKYLKECKLYRRRRLAKKLALKRRKQAAKRAVKGRAA